MKLRVEMTADSEIQISMNVNDEYVSFQYPEFVRRIYHGDLPIEPEYVGSFDEEQKTKLNRMLEEIADATTVHVQPETSKDE